MEHKTLYRRRSIKDRILFNLSCLYILIYMYKKDFGYEALTELIKKYDFNITLYPGHGNHTTLKNELENNPYLRGEIHE